MGIISKRKRHGLYLKPPPNSERVQLPVPGWKPALVLAGESL
jgi:hypothetical protein